jgi:hypothetical protein
VFLEHHLSRGDYRTKRSPDAMHERPKVRRPVHER